MLTDNAEQFWISRGHAYLSVLQTTVALVLCAAKPDMYFRHFLLQQCLLGIRYTFSIRPKDLV